MDANVPTSVSQRNPLDYRNATSSMHCVIEWIAMMASTAVMANVVGWLLFWSVVSWVTAGPLSSLGTWSTVPLHFAASMCATFVAVVPFTGGWTWRLTQVIWGGLVYTLLSWLFYLPPLHSTAGTRWAIAALVLAAATVGAFAGEALGRRVLAPRCATLIHWLGRRFYASGRGRS